MAAKALGSIGPAARDALPKLREVEAKDDEPEVQAAATEAITKIEAK